MKIYNLTDKQQIELLINSIKNNHIEMVDVLLSNYNININSYNLDGCTALIWAVKNDDIKSVKKILDIENIDVNITDNNNYTALMYACMLNNTEIIKILLDIKNINVNNKYYNNRTVLTWLSLHNQVNFIKKVLTIDKNIINCQDNTGYTALMYACEYGYVGSVYNLLYFNNIDVNIKSTNGYTALLLASLKGKYLIVSRLLKIKDIDVNAQSYLSGMTSLMYACEFHYTSIISILICHKYINMNIQNQNGYTAIMIAYKNKDKKLVNLLLSNRQTQDLSLTAYDIIKETKNNFEFVINILIKKYNMSLSDIVIEASKCNKKMVNHLLLDEKNKYENVIPSNKTIDNLSNMINLLNFENEVY